MTEFRKDEYKKVQIPFGFNGCEQQETKILKTSTEYLRDWRKKHPIKARRYGRNYRKNHPDRRRHLHREHRNEIISLLGSRCWNPDCPIPSKKLNLITLQIDHVNGEGNKERRETNSSYGYYTRILKKIKSGSQEYQLLCPYCNWLKRYEKKEPNCYPRVM